MSESLRDLQAAQSDLKQFYKPKIIRESGLQQQLTSDPMGLPNETAIRLGYALQSMAQFDLQPLRDTDPISRYGQVALKAIRAKVPSHPDHRIGFCLEAELRLAQMIALVEAGAPKYNPKKQAIVPAVIVKNGDHQPIGLIKNCGDRSMYTWKDVEIETSSGVRFLPGGAFSQIDLAYGIDYGTTQQMVVASSETVTSVSFGRLDMTHFEDGTRLEIAQWAAHNGWDAELTDHIAGAATYRPEDIGAVVEMLAA